MRFLLVFAALMLTCVPAPAQGFGLQIGPAEEVDARDLLACVRSIWRTSPWYKGQDELASSAGGQLPPWHAPCPHPEPR